MVDEPDQQPKQSPPWVWAVMVAFALVAVTAGAIVGMVATSDRGQAAPPEAASGTGAVEIDQGVAPPLLPETVPIGPVTDFPETGFPETGFTETIPIEPGTIETIPTVTEPPPSGLTQWPAGSSGFTVVLASITEAQGEAVAQSVAQRALVAGLSSVGVLRSADFSSLRPGFWVVFAGIYSTLEQARAALPQAQSAGYPQAYPRTVRP